MKNTKMRLFAVTAFLALFLIATPVFAAWQFEQQESAQGMTMNTTLTFGADALKADNKSMNSSIIMNFKTDKMMMVQHQMKTYLEMDISKIKAQMGDAMNKNAAPNDKIETKKTNEKKKINGFSCEKMLIIHNGKNLGEIWITKDLKDTSLRDVYKKFFNMAGGKGKEGGSRLKGLNAALDMGFPIQIKLQMQNGIEQKSQILSAKEVKAGAELFAVPAGYKKMSPQQMMMGGGRPPQGGMPAPPKGMPRPPAGK